MASRLRPVVSGVSYTVGVPSAIANLVHIEGAAPIVISMLEGRGLSQFRFETRPLNEVLWKVASASLAATGNTVASIDGIVIVNSPLKDEAITRALNGAGFSQTWLLGLNFQDCGGCEAAFRVATDLVQGGGRCRRVLVLLYGKISTGESRLGWSGETVFSDGACACVVSEETSGLEILASEMLTNPKLPWYREMGAQAKYFEECLSSLSAVAELALNAAGVCIADISKVFATNGSSLYHNLIASAIGISPRAIRTEDMAQYAHVFSCDGLIGMANFLSTNPVKSGDCFMLFSWSPFVMGAAILRQI